MLGKNSKSPDQMPSKSIVTHRLLPIIIILGVMYFIEEYLPFGLSLKSDVPTLLAQPWSLLTYGFVHHSSVHLVTSILLLALVAVYFQAPTRVFYTSFVAAILVGGLVFVLVYGVLGEHVGELTGASAGICGLIPIVLFFDSGRMKSVDHKVVRSLVGVLVLGDAAYSISVENPGFLAHVGGYLVGTIALLTVQKKHKEQIRKHNAIRKVELSGYSSLTEEERSIVSNSPKR